ncbi:MULTISPECIES: hypothetical protein [Pseudomonadaceae]|jgi:hypothetical protein|uniref:Uncharacterized protein n=2 Tax=Stutzerimonas stutzeri subgroup TaxID=578833 RepID=A0A0D7DYM5_STUST|nr:MULTISPECIES: hypothetical protein [Pseudomonadaceae]KIZ33674.1 hypothetical protein LO50_19615 [Stutzerimonas stutzeri]MCD1606390.1 hypothetical protein [Stutzerimonas kunmingensis]QUE77328.1 hypothetical protein KCX70_07145 [Stutzerimonas stutzeri]
MATDSTENNLDPAQTISVNRYQRAAPGVAEEELYRTVKNNRLVVFFKKTYNDEKYDQKSASSTSR